jgi:hypothetical protein
MIPLENRFGIRKQPSWARKDFESHVRLATELAQALKSLRPRIVVNIPKEFTNLDWNLETYQSLTKRERMYYFLDYALRLQRCYIFLMDAISPYCRAVISLKPSGCYSVTLSIEDTQYCCNYLTDYVCCLGWVVSKINFHIRSKTQEKS